MGTLPLGGEPPDQGLGCQGPAGLGNLGDILKDPTSAEGIPPAGFCGGPGKRCLGHGRGEFPPTNSHLPTHPSTLHQGEPRPLKGGISDISGL